MKTNEALRKARISRGLTQQELADKSGFGKVTIAHWEQGLRSPKPSSLRVLAETMGCNFDFLKGESEELEIPKEVILPDLTHIHARINLLEKQVAFLLEWYKPDMGKRMAAPKEYRQALQDLITLGMKNKEEYELNE